MSRRRVHNGVTYRWTRKGWQPVLRRRKPAHWSERYPAGLKPGADQFVPSDVAHELQNEPDVDDNIPSAPEPE